MAYINGALDIKTLAKLALPTVNKRDLEGLSKLCIRLLDGVALNKSQQISPWHQRPFTEEQMVYAGLDAWALVQLFDAVVRMLKNDYEGNNVCAGNSAGAGADGSTITVATNNKKKRNKLVETVEDSLRKAAKQYYLALPVPYTDFLVLPDIDSEIGTEVMVGTDEMVGISGGVDVSEGVSMKPYLPLRAIRMEEKNMPKHWVHPYNPPTRRPIKTL